MKKAAFLLAALSIQWGVPAGRPSTLAQDVFISEFLAINSSGITDEDGDASEWIEIYNPALEAVVLEGWWLTDDAGDLRKWLFPRVVLEAGGFLLVFASDKDRRDPASELHANFKLSSEGEYLALVRPDGFTVQDAYAPAFPPQHEDVSFGIGQVVAVSALVGEGSPSRIWIPTSGALDPVWTSPGFDDGEWLQGTTSVGYDTEADEGPPLPPDEEINLALTGAATQSSTGWGGEASRAIDGSTNSVYSQGSITHTASGDPAPTWMVTLGEMSAIDRIVLWNRSDCCSRRLSNFRVSVIDDWEETVFAEDFFTDGIGFPPPDIGFEIPLPAGTSGRAVKVEVLGPNAEAELYLCLAEVQVFEGIRGYDRFIETDVETAMFERGASAYIRVPFDAADPASFDILTMRIRYDDGFVAYLNGWEVARRNAPAGVASWDDAASAEHPDPDAVAFEAINLSGHLDVLQAGENLLAVHGLNVSSDDSDFLIGVRLEASSVHGDELRYFTEPTPGAANSTEGIVGFVADTVFSVDRGFFDAPFQVEITTATPGAEIRFTTDGSEPTETRGVRYSAPVLMETTTVLRAAAFKAGLQPTNIDTQTYIFLDDVIASSVMNTSITQDPAYAPLMYEALTDLPSISLATPGSFNDNTEVRTSIELIWPDGSPGFQENAGVKYFGGAFTNFAKKNFRCYFRGEYGARKLRYPLFAGHDRGIRAVEVFDQIELRGGSHDMNQRGFYMSNRLTDDTMLDMGNLNPHGRFVHLYINGAYWGQYHLRERWNADMLAQYLGGEKEDYEAINGNWNVGGWADPGVPYDGDGSAWTRIKSLRDDYEAVRPYLDVAHYIDFMLLFMFGNSELEYRCVGPKGAGSGFKFFLNDADGFTRDAGNRTVMSQPGRTDGDGPGSVFSMLLAEGHPDYLTLLGDRIHEHYFNDGAMTPEKMTARLLERCQEVERAFIAEAARWGYRTPASWESAKNSYISNVLPSRTATVVSQFRAAGFYPGVEAPVLNRHGGDVRPGFVLTMTAPAGTVYYTLDSSDPRLPGGALSPGALVAGEIETEIVLPEGADVRILVPEDGSLGLDWTQLDFDDGGWTTGQTGVGYEESSGYEDEFATDVGELMYGRNTSVYLRIPFELDPSLFSGGEAVLAMLILGMKYDDGYVAYLNGVEVTARNAPDPPAWDSRATATHSDALAVVFEDANISEVIPALRPGWNILAIQGLNTTSTGSDFLIVPRLEAASSSQATILQESTRVKARALVGGAWSALTEATFIMDTPLRITEIMYHPAPPAPGSGLEESDFEFIELQNTGEQILDLAGMRLEGGISFGFSEGEVAELGPGEIVLVVRNREGFALRYDAAGMLIAGEYEGRLENSGEEIELLGPFGEEILRFAYDESWYPETDGAGPSLVIVDHSREPSTWRSSASWRPSDFLLGSPGLDESAGDIGGWQLPGDINQDASIDLSDAIGLLLHLYGGRFQVLPCGDGTVTDAGNRALLDANGDESVGLSDAIYLLHFLFLSGSPPVLGARCTRIAGCPHSCR